MEVITHSAYVSLKGAWTPHGAATAATKIDTFFRRARHDGLGEPNLDDDGHAYAYSCQPSTQMIDELMTELAEMGPAVVLTTDAGDGLEIMNYVIGRDIAKTAVVGEIGDEMPVPLNRIDDQEFIQLLRKIIEIDGMPFSISFNAA